jgi:hypothetical protein
MCKQIDSLDSFDDRARRGIHGEAARLKPPNAHQGMASEGFSPGPRLSDAPQGDVARQAVAALRGYAFQLYGSVLAWLELKEGEDLFSKSQRIMRLLHKTS